MIDPNEIAALREIWAVVDNATALPGDGSKDNPWRLGGNLDLIVPRLGPSARLHLGPGEYLTKGFRPPRIFILDGETGTVIKLRDFCLDALNIENAAVRMISDCGSWVSFFSCSNVELNGNWANQFGSQSDAFKIEPVVVNCLQGLVKNCRVINWGATGKRFGNDGFEAFPLSLNTVASGDLEFYLPQYRMQFATELTPTRLEILANIVELPHFSSGGYATGIKVASNFGLNGGDRQPMRTRTSVAALIRGNRVIVPGGICYGAGELGTGPKADWGAEQVVFEDNFGSGKCAWNGDTGALFKIVIRNNRFIDVSQGPNITPSGNGDDVSITDNVIQLGKPHYNEILEEDEAQWGIRVERVTNARAHNNTFLVPASYAGPILQGIDGMGNEVTPLDESDSAALAAANDRILALTNELAVAQVQLTGAGHRLAELTTELTDAGSKIQTLTDQLDIARNQRAKDSLVIVVLNRRITEALAALDRA